MKMKNTKWICVGLTLTVGLSLLFGCGKQAEPEASSEASETAQTAASQTEQAAETEAASEMQAETSAAELAATSMDAYYWEWADCAISYPAGFVPEETEPEESQYTTGNGTILTGTLTLKIPGEENSEVLIQVTDAAEDSADFAAMNSETTLLLMGMDALVTRDATDETITMPHFSGAAVDGRKVQVQNCVIDEEEARCTVLFLNSFDADRYIVLAAMSDNPSYFSYCENLEEYFYFGDCQVENGTVTQNLLPPPSGEQTAEVAAVNASITLPEQWRQVEDMQADLGVDPSEYEAALGFITEESDILCVAFSQGGYTDAEFQASFESQKQVFNSGGSTLLDVEQCTIDGYTAYRLHVSQPSWGRSSTDAETVTVTTWLINRTGEHPNIVHISLTDASTTQQADMEANLERYLEI